jgi:hypothetical protein
MSLGAILSYERLGDAKNTKPSSKQPEFYRSQCTGYMKYLTQRSSHNHLKRNSAPGIHLFKKVFAKRLDFYRNQTSTADSFKHALWISRKWILSIQLSQWPVPGTASENTPLFTNEGPSTDYRAAPYGIVPKPAKNLGPGYISRGVYTITLK